MSEQQREQERPDEGVYEVWHARDMAAMRSPAAENAARFVARRADEYEKVAELEVASLSDAFSFSQHGQWDWTTVDCVRWHAPGSQIRSTSVGDVFVFAQSGQAWLVKSIGFEPIGTVPDAPLNEPEALALRDEIKRDFPTALVDVHWTKEPFQQTASPCWLSLEGEPQARPFASREAYRRWRERQQQGGDHELA